MDRRRLLIGLGAVGLMGGGLAKLGAAPGQPAPRAGRPVRDVQVVWSPGYRVSFFGVEKLHPFDIGKLDRIANGLVSAGVMSLDDMAVPAPVTTAVLKQLHDPDYVDSLNTATALGRALEIRLPSFIPGALLKPRVLMPFQAACGGTVAAARAALQVGCAVNIGGGFHHARQAFGHGFCLFNDVAAAIRALRADGFTGKIVIFDTDAHQGDGNHDFFAHDPSVFSLSIHESNLFPHPKLAGDHDIGLATGVDDAGFLQAVKRGLEVADGESPALVIHVAGSDVLADDPLTGLRMTVPGLVRRDLTVANHFRKQGIPFVQVLAGGYGPSSAVAQLAAVQGLVQGATLKS